MRRIFGCSLVSAGLFIASYGMAFAQNPESQSNEPQRITIAARKYDFSPGEIHVHKGAKVELKVHSEDETHGVKLSLYPEGTKESGVPGLLFDHPEQNGKVEKGVDQVLDFVAQQPGVYDFKCAKVCGFGHNRMKGKLVVEP
jgi:cytochrome c oxidase subunit II